MASMVEIANRALQKVGAKRIVSLDEDNVAARACNVALTPVRLAMLRNHTWSCATRREQLAADSPAPTWGPKNSFTLPSDFIRLLDDDDFAIWGFNSFNSVNNSRNFSGFRDWKIEGRKIITDDVAPLNVRFVYDLLDPNTMDPLFREALSTNLALELCEELTQSNQKKDSLKLDLKQIIADAKHVNAIEKPAGNPAEDEWNTVRR